MLQSRFLLVPAAGGISPFKTSPTDGVLMMIHHALPALK